MKKICFIIFIMCGLPSFALKTTLTSSVYPSQSTGNISQQFTALPTNARRVRIFNRIDSLPEFATAITAAEYIFSNAMQQENIDLVEIQAELLMGNYADFQDNAICRVNIDYTDSIIDNSHYHCFSALYSPIHLLYPKAMTNQTRGNSSDVDMHIILNPTLTYHCDTTFLSSSDFDKYDLITVLLRALAIGCGIQSSLDPVTMQFGRTLNGNTYITPFDTKITNDNGDAFYDVTFGYVSAADFLVYNSIYAEGLDDSWSTIPIQLFNDWEFGLSGTNVSSNTLNSIDPFSYINSGFVDLLDAELRSGTSIRSVTPLTMALLRKIGWEKTVPVGTDPLENLYNCSLSCNNAILSPNTNYIVSISSGNTVDLCNAVCKINSVDTSLTIGSVSTSNVFSYSSIPQNIQWQRNPISKNIVGQMQGTVGMLVDNNYITQQKTFDIEIPYIPNRPIIHKSETTNNNYIQLHLKAFANGSNTYSVTYTGVTYADTHSFTITANDMDTILSNIPANQLYNATIYGTNNVGNSSSYNFTFGFSAQPTLTMNVFVYPNATVVYDLSNNGLIDISDVVISSVAIYNTYGNLMFTTNKGSGESIDVSSLNTGRYVLTVVADGKTYSKTFVKR